MKKSGLDAAEEWTYFRPPSTSPPGAIGNCFTPGYVDAHAPVPRQPEVNSIYHNSVAHTRGESVPLPPTITFSQHLTNLKSVPTRSFTNVPSDDISVQ